ncbi:protein kinase [Nocardia uniformis]|uniref:non-specific serine/threonine protein kinase n=1 Tax=Nocardia uniformis TaxID=53432 RepID=A0A849BYF3_9NOCA|nr:serine/threonine-protein kinase [Nocardia uniformis]NNH70288.1 protein kinase [Nocardia uniformis]
MGDGRLGRYRLDELLGSGGSGQVWRALDTMTDRTVALKVLAPALAADASYRRRFEREARAAARLRGPHVVPLHHFGEVEGRLFIETAFIDGVDLESLLEWEGARTPEAGVELIAQVATALDEAHAAGVIHRDVKPSNIMVGLDDVAYLIDFGTAQQDGQSSMTLSGMVIGTPAYMAPERFTGHATARSDIYSLACVLYECLTGERPFRERNPARLMHAHVNVEPPRASDVNSAVPRRLNEVIARGMAKDPSARYASAGEFARATRASLRAPDPDPPTLALPPVATGATTDLTPPTEPLARIAKPSAAQRGSRTGRTEVIDKRSVDARGHPGTERRRNRRRLAAALVPASVIAAIIGAAWFSSLGPATQTPTTVSPATSVPETSEQQPIPALEPLASTAVQPPVTESESPITVPPQTAPATVPPPESDMPDDDTPDKKPDAKPDKEGHGGGKPNNDKSDRPDKKR